MKIWTSVAQKLAESIVTLVILVVVTFFLLRALPGGPLDEQTSLNPTVRAEITAEWGLDRPVAEQLGKYFSNIFRGDLGVSFFQSRPVSELLSTRWSSTFWLNFIALIFAVILGLTLALGMSRSGRMAKYLEQFSVMMISLPSLFLGPLLIWLFAMKLDLLPAALLDSPVHFILPVLTLATRPAAVVARILAKALGEAKHADYMRTAKAKGLSENQALIHHAFKNSILPLLGASSPLILQIISGSFLVETLFAIPGLGSLFVSAIANRDLPVVLGLTLFEGGLLIFLSFVADTAIRFADPRLRSA